MAKRSATGRDRLRYEDRIAQVWELRKAGASYAQIAQQIGVNKGNLSRWVRRKLDELARNNIEGAEDIRRIELERLDVALLAIWPQVRSGNHGAIDRLVRIQERRARLLGLDAPARQEVSGPDGGPIDFVRRVAASEELTRAAHDFLRHVELSAGGAAVEPSGDGL